MRETGVVRARFDGDTKVAQTYLGLARTVLGVLKNRMSLGQLAQGQQALNMPNGVRIVAQSVFGQDVVDIVVPEGAGPAPGFQQEQGQVYAPQQVGVSAEFTIPPVTIPSEVWDGVEFRTWDIDVRNNYLAIYPAVGEQASQLEAQLSRAAGFTPRLYVDTGEVPSYPVRASHNTPLLDGMLFTAGSRPITSPWVDLDPTLMNPYDSGIFPIPSSIIPPTGTGAWTLGGHRLLGIAFYGAYTTADGPAYIGNQGNVNSVVVFLEGDASAMQGATCSVFKRTTGGDTYPLVTTGPDVNLPVGWTASDWSGPEYVLTFGTVNVVTGLLGGGYIATVLRADVTDLATVLNIAQHVGDLGPYAPKHPNVGVFVWNNVPTIPGQTTTYEETIDTESGGTPTVNTQIVT